MWNNIDIYKYFASLIFEKKRSKKWLIFEKNPK